MKNIFKKNQIIITALAIMIAIAGYLSFTNNDNTKEVDSVQTTNPDLEDYDVILELDKTDVSQEATDGDVTASETTDDANVANADAEVADAADATADGKDADKTVAEETGETVPVSSEEDTGEITDISDQDILDAAQDVTDNGELNLDGDEIPGEAVLASTTIDPGFFSSAKLSREQVRARNKETLMDIIDNANLEEADKQDAIDNMIELTAIAEKENATELLLEAKGFDGTVVSIIEDSVDVVINATNITDQQIAIIEDVVTRKTDIPVSNIVITPVVVGE